MMDSLKGVPYGTVSYQGMAAQMNAFVIEKQLYDQTLWKIFVQQFRDRKDSDDGGWRGEFFGKMMRGACLTYKYTCDTRLVQILENAIEDFLTTQDDLGRFSTYIVEKEFTGWDMWGRKYAMLGLEYFYEISDNENLKTRILVALEKHADYIVGNVGEGKKHPIAYAISFWHHAGLPSCSILEPFMKLYALKPKQAYLDFATEIVRTGFTNTDENLIEVFYKQEKNVNELSVKKAYEMMSCFQGLLEYYKVVKDEKYLTSLNNFMNSVIETELTEIGALGTSYEFFDNSVDNQTEPKSLPIAETCVTVTFMNLCYQMLQFTGESRFADYIEKSAYNAMFGAVNTRENQSVCKWANEVPHLIDTKYFMPFDSYSPLVMQRRAIDVGGLKQLTQDGMKYGCCTCISSTGTAISALYGIMKADDVYIINSYEECAANLFAPSGREFTLQITGKPFENGETTKITLQTKSEETLTFKLRIPEWSKTATVVCKGKRYETVGGKYFTLSDTFVNGDVIEIETDNRIYAVQRNGKTLLKKCGIVLARDERYQDGLEECVAIAIGERGVVSGRKTVSGKFETRAEFQIPLIDGCEITMCDYASAGKEWDSGTNTRINVWL
ncbi:MAG: hypothetical protein E7357_01975 [Clostridiales bacterium]|nr:hypothetical protein [Clostridiales bacterium]